jgi:hypothetical protein
MARAPARRQRRNMAQRSDADRPADGAGQRRHTDDPCVADVGGHALLPEAEVAAVGHYVGVVSINHLHPHSLASASPPRRRLCHKEPGSRA